MGIQQLVKRSTFTTRLIVDKITSDFTGREIITFNVLQILNSDAHMKFVYQPKCFTNVPWFGFVCC